MTRVAVLVGAALLASCARQRPAAPADAAATIARANELARDRASHEEARALYRRVVRAYPGTPAAADALHGLGRLYVDPESPLHDWGRANVAFGLLLAKHPDSRYAAEARAWRAALGELLESEAETRRLSGRLDRLKELDMQEEQVE